MQDANKDQAATDATETRKGKFGKDPKTVTTPEATATATASTPATEGVPANAATDTEAKPKRIRRTKAELEADGKGQGAKNKTVAKKSVGTRTELSAPMLAAHTMVANAYAMQTGYHPDVEQIRIAELVTVAVPFGAISPDYQQVGAVRVQLDPETFVESVLYDTFSAAALTGIRVKDTAPYMQDFNEYINQ